MKKQYTIWDNLFLEDGKYRNKLLIGLIISGLVVGAFITDFTSWKEIGFYFTAYVLGVPCVIALGDRDGLWGNVLGLASNVGEVIINLQFGAAGMAVSGLYFGITHIVGLVRNMRPETKDEKGKMKVTNMEASQAKFTLVFLVLGVIFMLFFGDIIGFERNLTDIFYWLNIASFVISVMSQYLMIIGKKEAWFGWFLSNFVNFAINLMAFNFWFMFRDIIYQVNAIRTMYVQKRIEN